LPAAALSTTLARDLDRPTSLGLVDIVSGC
jgi:hypothetical protein